MSDKIRYTLGGAMFGLLFPLFSLTVDSFIRGYPFNWEGIMMIHSENVIHFVVDTAPLVLGVAGYLLGKSSQKKKDFNNRLKRINRSLDTFTFKITHDLRSPALNIQGLVEILQSRQDELTPAERKDILDKLNTSVDRWLGTFKDFIELLKEEKTGIRQSRNCQLTSVLNDVKNQLHLEIEQSGAVIHEDFSRCKSIYASPSDLNSIFKNLLTNAIKYVDPNDNPEIHIQSIRGNKEGIIMLEDNGIGMDLEEHGQRIFNLFERIDNDLNAEGTGVGLYLIKEQIEKNRGTIEVESTPGEGTSFTITFPLSGSKKSTEPTTA